MSIKQTAYFKSGTEEKITLVLSCPGASEEAQGKPAAGKSGENLEKILEELNKLTTTEDWMRNKVTITNAWSKVEYASKTGRSEATKSEIHNEENLNRLFSDVKQTKEYIVCFGEQAQEAIQKVKKIHYQEKSGVLPKIINARHPSFQSLNQISKDIRGNNIVKKQKDATKKRIEVVAQYIFNQL